MKSARVIPGVLVGFLVMGQIAWAKIVESKLPAGSPGWAFRPGEVVEMKIEAGQAEALKLTDRSGYSRKLDYWTEGEFAYFNLPTDRNGLFYISDGTEEVSYAVIPEPSKPISEDGYFGVNFHLDRTVVEEGLKEIEYAKYIGISWGRGMIKDFVDVKDGPDYENTTKYFDNGIEIAANSGINVLGNIYFFPKWMHKDKSDSFIWYAFTAPEDMSEVKNYTRFIAKRCPFVKYWEVGNECDAQNFFRGRLSSAGDEDKIIRDYAEYLRLASEGFREGNPDCKMLFQGGTSVMPEGEHHKPFLKTVCEAGGLDCIDVMNLHYGGNIPKCREVMAPYANGREYPFWVTESGGYADGERQNEVQQVRRDTLLAMEQLADGASKTFKYLLRNCDLEGMNGKSQNHEDNFGLIDLFFHPKEAYVSYATMIRFCDGATDFRRLNVTRCCDDGFLKGFSWQKDGVEYNYLILEAADQANVSIPVADENLALIDIFGEEGGIEIQDGKLELSLDKYPVLIRGKLNPPEGKVVYPTNRKIASLPIDFPDLVENMEKWNISPIDGVQVQKLDDCVRVTIEHKPLNTYWSMYTPIFDKLDEIRKGLGPKQYLRVYVKAELKYQLLAGGVNVGCNMFSPEYVRLSWYETSFTYGNKDWTTVEMEGGDVLDIADKINMAVNFSPDSKGWCEIRNPQYWLEIWERP